MRTKMLMFFAALGIAANVSAQISPASEPNFGNTDPNIIGIGIGNWPAPLIPKARLHVNHFYCQSTAAGNLTGLFRTDGNSTEDNNWQIFTGVSSSNLFEALRISIPKNTSNAVFNTPQNSGNIQFQTGGQTRLFIQNNDDASAQKGFVGINTTQPQYRLDVNGDAKISGKVLMGSAEDQFTWDYTPGTSTTPALLKLIPSGSHNSVPGPGTGNSPDPTPNLSCLNGDQMPTNITAFPGTISVAKNNAPGTTAPTGGNILLGHTGVNAFIETQGTGTGANNHPGDLFINSTCSRNVLFFTHATPFANGANKVVSIDGALNVRRNMQLGDWSATTFSDANSRLYILADPGSSSNGIRVKHGSVGRYGIKIVEYNANEKAFAITKAPNSTTDGSEVFSVQGSGKTTIGDKTQAAPGHTDALLTVYGKMVAKSCYITTDNWADFVFNKDYSLMDLYELEKYYLANKHLPSVPSEKEVVENGVELAEMNRILLQKVEELTLYMVQMQKELDALKKSSGQN